MSFKFLCFTHHPNFLGIRVVRWAESDKKTDDPFHLCMSRLWLRRSSRSSANRKIGSLIPGSYSQSVLLRDTEFQIASVGCVVGVWIRINVYYNWVACGTLCSSLDQQCVNRWIWARCYTSASPYGQEVFSPPLRQEMCFWFGKIYTKNAMSIIKL